MISTLPDMRKWVEHMVRGYGYSGALSQRRFQDRLPLLGVPASVNISYGLAALELNGFCEL